MNNTILFLLIIHFLFCLIYFIINLKFNGLQDSFYRLVIVFFLPVFGLLFFIISAILNKTVKKSDTVLDSYLKHIRDNTHIYHEESIDFEKEINIIPIEDSLSFDDNKSKREYLIYILKKGFGSHINGLKKAIKSKDTETSHYAAAALTEIKKQFEVLIQSASEEYIENKDNFEAIKKYVDVLKKYLKSSLADRFDYEDYLEKYSAALGRLLLKDHTNENYFTDKIYADIEIGDYKSAFKLCEQFYNYFPNSEKPLIALLKFYFITGNYELFEKILSTLKNKKIEYGGHSENIIKFWEDLKVNVY
ncbi:MAG: hypothetical protein M1409_07460 [Actinobacteria bacterium]|nr:hypothetical protein [Actinomycetota bacterium]